MAEAIALTMSKIVVRYEKMFFVFILLQARS